TAHSGKFPAWKVTWRGLKAGLGSVAAVNRKDAWAVGAKEPGVPYILHWDGKRWLNKPLPRRGFFPFVVGASSPSNVWLYGTFANTGAAFRWNGSHWQQSQVGGGGGGEKLVVLSPSDVWLAYMRCDGQFPCLFHWNGSGWTTIKEPRHFLL